MKTILILLAYLIPYNTFSQVPNKPLIKRNALKADSIFDRYSDYLPAYPGGIDAYFNFYVKIFITPQKSGTTVHRD